jgi:hypothetical protein
MPAQPSPAKISINAIDKVRAASRAIQIVNPQMEMTTILFGYIMGNLGRIYMTKMQGASWAWCKSRNHNASLPELGGTYWLVLGDNI